MLYEIWLAIYVAATIMGSVFILVGVSIIFFMLAYVFVMGKVDELVVGREKRVVTTSVIMVIFGAVILAISLLTMIPIFFCKIY